MLNPGEMCQRMRQGFFKLKKISKMNTFGTFVVSERTGDKRVSLHMSCNVGTDNYFATWTDMSFKKFLEQLSEIDGGEFFHNGKNVSGYIEDGHVKLHFEGTWQQVAEEAIKVHGIQLAKHICKEITTLDLEIESVSFLNSEIKGNDAE